MLDTGLELPFIKTLCSEALLEWPRYTPYEVPDEIIGTYCIYNGFLYYVDYSDKKYYMTPNIEEAKIFLEKNGYRYNNFFIFPQNSNGGNININLLDIAHSEGHKLFNERNRLEKIRQYTAIGLAKGITPLHDIEYDQTIEIDRLGIDVRLEGNRQHLFLNYQNENNLANNIGTFNISMNGTIMFVNEQGRTFISPSWDYYLVLLNSLGYQSNPDLILPEVITTQGFIPTSGSIEVDPISQKWGHWKADCIQRSHSQNDIYLRACEIFNQMNQASNGHSR